MTDETRYPSVPPWFDHLMPDESYRRLSDAINYLLARTQTGWDDLRFPVQAINPPGAASDPTLESTTGLLRFSGTKTELVYGVAQLPHEWAEGTSLYPHVHWCKTSSVAGDVLWQFDYEVVANGAVASLTYPNQLQVTTPVEGTPDNDTTNEVLISALGELPMAGHNVSCLIIWKLSRIGGDALDTYNADARLFEMDFHYQIDSFGSEEEFRKDS